MKTNDLINSLSTNVKKVEVVKFTKIDLFKSISVGLLCVLTSVGFQGLRIDLQAQLQSWSYWVELFLMLLLGLTSLTAALTLSIPSQKSNKNLFLSILPFVGLVLIVSYSLARYSNATYVLSGGFGCISQILASAILPSGFIFWMTRKAAALKRDKLGAFAALFGLSFGLLSVQLSCYDSSPLHIFVWHLLPVLLFALTGLAIGKKILKQI